jgi:hypothetical protein
LNRTQLIRQSVMPVIVDDDTAETTTDTTKMHRSVSFDRLHFREYPCVIGDHPSTSSGIPVQLGWRHQASYSVDVREYETTVARRTSLQLRMPAHVRDKLIGNEETDEKKQTVIRGVRKVQQQRRQTAAMIEFFDPISEMYESARRKLTRWRQHRKKHEFAQQEDPAAVWLTQWRLRQLDQNRTESDTDTSPEERLVPFTTENEDIDCATNSTQEKARAGVESAPEPKARRGLVQQLQRRNTTKVSA